MKRSSKSMLWLFLLLVGGGGGYAAWLQFHTGNKAVTYRTAPVTRGDLLATIGATGSLEPEEAIDVGAQVAGQISQFGTEGGKPIDRRSFVKAGDLLALIDPSLYKMELESADAQLAQSNALLTQSEAQLAQSDAQLAQSEANVVKAEADIQLMEAKRVQAEQDLSRAQKVIKEAPDALSETSFDGFKAAHATAVAAVSSANAAKVQVIAAKAQAKAGREQALAAIVQAKAAIKQTQAVVNRAQRNLDYCTINSPVDGVIIDRRVNIGQTVVSSLNAPSLFLIAKDLSRMQIWVSVNEADIGSIHNDQPVTFTVDARPGKTFAGKVTKVRFDATMTQNVVTYPVEVLALNPDGLLYPYMTANVQFELDRRTNVFKVPNAALAYSPLTEEQVSPEFRSDVEKQAQLSGTHEASAKPLRPGKGKDSTAAPVAQEKPDKTGLLWIQQGAFLRPITVRIGMTDGTMTEVENPDLKEELAVIISEQRPTSAIPEGSSPFVPQIRRR